MARPTKFTQELADNICERIAAGESLRAICEGKDYPDRRTVNRWLFKNEEFCHQYTHAREAQADRIIEDIIDIADTTTPELVNVAKLRLDARKFYITKVAPKRFGDRITQEITGKDGGAVKVEQSLNMDKLSDEELRTIIELQRKASASDISA